MKNLGPLTFQVILFRGMISGNIVPIAGSVYMIILCREIFKLYLELAKK